MTFPVIASFTNDTYALNSSIAYGSAGRAIDLPSVVAGDGIIVTLNVRFGSGSGARFGTFSGYTKIADDGGTTNIAIFWRQCDGTEGSTVTIPTAGDSGGQYSSTVVKYAAANKGDWSITPPEGVINGFASATNPFAIPTLTPSFSGDTQWLVFMGTQPGTTTLTTYPTGFTDNQTLVSSSVGGSLCKLYYATQDLNTASLSGLTFVLNQTAVGAAAMVAVAGIGGGASGWSGDPFEANQTVGGAPATNPGDPIGELVNQEVGATFDFTQSTSGTRPTYSTIPRGGVRNRLLPSNDLTNAAWSKFGGTVTATEFTPTAATALHAVGQIVPTPAGSLATFSADIIAGGLTILQLVYDNGSGANACYVNFNINTGVITRGPFAIGSASNASFIISPISGGYRVSLTGQIGMTAGRTYFVALNAVDSNAIPYTSSSLTTADKFSVFNAQFEFGGAATAPQQVSSIYEITEAGTPSIECAYNDSGDFLTSGIQEYTPTADYFADTGQALTDWFAFASFVKGGTAGVAKAGATAANRTFQTIIDGTSGQLRSYIRGGDTENVTGDLATGRWHFVVRRITGSLVEIWVDGVKYTPTVGAATEESEDIILGGRTAGSFAQGLTGYQDFVGGVAVALTDGEVDDLIQWGKNKYIGGVAANPVLGGGSAANPLWGYIA